MVQFGQAFHTSYVLFSLTGMPSFLKILFALLVGFGIDIISVSLVGRGNNRAALHFLVFYFLINVYAFCSHSSIYFYVISEGSRIWSYTGFFALIPSFYIPYAGHVLALELGKKTKVGRPRNS